MQKFFSRKRQVAYLNFSRFRQKFEHNLTKNDLNYNLCLSICNIFATFISEKTWQSKWLYLSEILAPTVSYDKDVDRTLRSWICFVCPISTSQHLKNITLKKLPYLSEVLVSKIFLSSWSGLNPMFIKTCKKHYSLKLRKII